MPTFTERMIPTRHSSWDEFARRTGGKMIRNRFWKSDEVVSRMGEWEVHLHTVMLDSETGAPSPGTFWSTRRGTAVWAGFRSLDGFRLSVRDRQWAHRQAGFLRWEIDVGRMVDAARRRMRPEDTEIGNVEFDQRFVSRSNQPERMKTFFDARLLQVVLGRPAIAEITIDGPEEDGTPQPATLVVWEKQMIQSAEELLDLHEVLLALLERLVRVGSAGAAGGSA